MAIPIRKRFRPPSVTTVEAETLLMRYPDLSETELAKLINLFPYIRVLDLGMMTTDERLAARLDAFHRDHGDRLGTPISWLIAFLAVPLIAIAGGLLWWLGSPVGP